VREAGKQINKIRGRALGERGRPRREKAKNAIGLKVYLGVRIFDIKEFVSSMHVHIKF
jgi:hypothetical protein